MSMLIFTFRRKSTLVACLVLVASPDNDDEQTVAVFHALVLVVIPDARVGVRVTLAIIDFALDGDPAPLVELATMIDVLEGNDDSGCVERIGLDFALQGTLPAVNRCDAQEQVA